MLTTQPNNPEVSYSVPGREKQKHDLKHLFLKPGFMDGFKIVTDFQSSSLWLAYVVYHLQSKD